MDVAQRIRLIRKERGLSQETIVNVLQTTQQQYSRYENGDNELPVRHVVSLCRSYGVSADWMLGSRNDR